MKPAISQVLDARIEAERSLLGSLIIDPDQIWNVRLEATDFYIHRHRWIYEVILRGAKEYNEIIDALEKAGRLREIGGAAYVTRLIACCEDSQDAYRYAQQVREGALKERLLREAERLARIAVSPAPIPLEVKHAFLV
ncbi:MAG: DnaB-like helicase N-terminal domain-containing protein [Anaerolineales bacterium]|nr:MAG: DnaB-like helicase N-terminal domain-containing protein [Anaerolineales bacterium]